MPDATFGTPAELVPSYKQTILQSNYIDFTDAAHEQWAQENMPDIYEDEVERYGNRTLSGFLEMMGAEYPLESDQVIWTEQGRLHLSYDNVTVADDGSGANVLSMTGATTHAVRKGQTIVITDGTTTVRAFVTAGQEDDNTELTVECYTNATGLVDAGLPTTADACKFFVFGSEFNKGTVGMDSSIDPEINVFNVKPIITKDNYTVNGSDTAQIGWVNVSTEGGDSGNMWYLKASGDTKTRFNDYLEMSLLESVEATNANLAVKGTQGYFSAVESRGITASDMFDAAGDVISDFRALTKELDKQGSIEENMLYLNRDSSNTFDEGLAAANSYGSGGTSYGVFQNSEDMALNLGFSGVRVGSYDFYKSDWKYLNDGATRGSFTDVKGTLVPAGTVSVYDQMMGQNIRRPFLHVRYRAKGAVNRKLMTTVLGLAAGTSDLDAMSLELLSERALVTQAANNFAIFQ